MPQKKRLTSTIHIRTIVRGKDDVDATAKKLVDKLRQLEMQEWRIKRDRRAIQLALHAAGIRPGMDVNSNELSYAQDLPFMNKTLSESCEQILKDSEGQWLTKTQVEYLVVRGGYSFSAKDSKNSVDVTLRRLAVDGKCAADRVRGSRGNRYRWMNEKSSGELNRALEEMDKSK